jgi:hypothetical protein
VFLLKFLAVAGCLGGRRTGGLVSTGGGEIRQGLHDCRFLLRNFDSMGFCAGLFATDLLDFKLGFQFVFYQIKLI